MAKPRNDKKPATRKQSFTTGWEKLTWSDLNDWAGDRSVSRGRLYQKEGRVIKLRKSNAGALLAWVRGGDLYRVGVQLDARKRRRCNQIVSECSCPVQFNCKHAVAAILEYFDALDKGKAIPIATSHDLQLIALHGEHSSEDDDWEYDEWTEDDEFPEVPICRQGGKTIRDSDIRDYLASKSSADLVDMVMLIYNRDQDVRRALVDEYSLANGRFDKLLSEAQTEMRSLTAEEAWVNSWTGEGHVPDYSGLEKRLKTLLDHGYADAVVQLGKELFKRGTAQVERADDGGETCYEIGKCMRVAYEALLKSDRSDEDKIMYAIDILLADHYEMCEEFDILHEHWKKATWSVVADRLCERLRLQSSPIKGDDGLRNYERNYERSQLSDWALFALDNAGRTEEVMELCISEAREWSSYERAARYLMDMKDIKRAEEMAMEGVLSTPPRYSGIVISLQDLLCQIAKLNSNHILPASVAADRFFSQPSVDNYHTLLKLAKKARQERTVQAQAFAFLEGGHRPDMGGKGKSKGKKQSDWPFPEPPMPDWMRDERRSRSDPKKPYFDVLIDLAIDEKRPDDVLMWFDRRETANKLIKYRLRGREHFQDARVADAVQKKYPERAIAIYLHLAESVAAETKTRTYPEVGEYLRRIRKILKKSGREGEWSAIISKFRAVHKRKRRLMEVLDGIEGRPIA